MSKNGDREERFIEYLALGIPLRDAGLKAGYSPTYCSGTLPRKLHSPNFIKKIQAYCDDYPKYRTTLAKLRLAKVFQIEENILNKALTDTDYAVTPGVSKTVEREYKLTGLLQEPGTTQVLVPIQVSIDIQGSLEDQQAGKTVLIENTEKSDTT